jgi:hypothetical protein
MEAGAAGSIYALTTNWPTAESSALSLPRTSLSPASTSKVLWTIFTLSPDAAGDWSALQLSLRHRSAVTAAAPTHVRAWISWYDGTQIRTRSSPATALASTTAEWSTSQMGFSNGATALPTGAGLGKRSFLVEWQFFGAASASNNLWVDDVILGATSLTGSQPLVFRTGSVLPEARSGTAYQAALTASGGLPPYVWGLSAGSLPAGLSLNATTGTISGTPTSAGSSSFTLRVTDGAQLSATRATTLNVLAAGATLSIGNTVWADVNQNGLRESSEPGIAGITLRLFAATADIATATPLATTVSTTGGQYGFRNLSPGSYRVALTPTTTYARTGGNPVSLDNGIDHDNNGLQPGGAGTMVSSPVIALATATEPGSSGRSNKDSTIDFGLAPTADAKLSIQPATLAPAFAGEFYSTVLSATGGVAPYAWAVSAGTLPAGLTLQSTTGLISGTTTAAVGSYRFSIRATDASGISGVRAYTFSVSAPALTISPSAVPAARVGSAYAASLTATGGTAPFRWSVSAGTLPQGITLNAVTGQLSGTPTTSGTSRFTIRAVSADQLMGSSAFDLVVSSTQITISPPSLPPAKTGSAYLATLGASGGTAPYAWSIASGVLPAGLTLNSTTGVISGTPQVPSNSPGSTVSAGFAVQGTDANGLNAFRSYLIPIENASITIAPSVLPEFMAGQAITPLTMQAAGGVAPYTWGVLSGTLPAGLSLSSSGVISGTPTTSGTTPITIAVTDANSSAVSRSYSVFVRPATLITISPATLPVANPALPYQVTLIATGGTSPYTWAVSSGSLPPGLTLNVSTGVISGTFASTATATTNNYPFRIRATSSDGTSGQRDYTLTTGGVLPPLTISPSSLAPASVGTAFSQSFSASGGTAPYVWSVSAGTLPAGLSLNTSTGILAGTPTAAGTQSFSLRAMDSSGRSGTIALVLTIRAGANLGLGNLIWADLNENGLKDSNEPGLGGIQVRLHAASVNAATDAPLMTTVTSSSGIYGFQVANPGSYVVSFMPPNTYPAVSRVSVALDNGIDNDSNARQTGGTGTLVTSPVITLGAGVEPSGGGTGNTDNTVDFGLIAVLSAPLTITSSPPAPAVAGTAYSHTFTVTGGIAPYAWSLSAGTLPAGLTLRTAGVLSGTPVSASTSTNFTVRARDSIGRSITMPYSFSVSGGSTSYPSSFVLWQRQNSLMGTALEDSDADGSPNLLEYALGTPPRSGTGLAGRFSLAKSTSSTTSGGTAANTLTGMIQAEVSRPSGGQNDLFFVLEAIGDLAGSPAGWRPVSTLPTMQTTAGGLIRRVWQALESPTSTATGLLNTQRGFVRLRVSLDADLNGIPEATVVTPAFGWMRLSPAEGSSLSLGMPFVLPATYGCQVVALEGGNLLLGDIAGGMNAQSPGFAELLSGGRQFYVEIVSGAAEGRRYEIDEALTISWNGSAIVLDLLSPLNTDVPAATQLVGSRIVVRPHWTLGSAFDPAEFLGGPAFTGADPASQHRLNSLNADGITYTTFAVAGTSTGPRWSNTAEAGSADLNNRVIRPDEGHILRVAGTRSLAFTLLGQVRDTAFARPLAATSQLLSNPWPMFLAPQARALSTSSGFLAGQSAAVADNIVTFESAASGTGDLPRTYFLSGPDSTAAWQPSVSGDPPLGFPPASAAFFRPATARPAWVQPRPWLP